LFNTQEITFHRLKELVEEISQQGTSDPVGYLSLELPEKKLWCKIAEKVEVHLCGKMLPDISTQRPNENPASKAVRQSMYKPVTIVDTQKAVNAIQSALNRTPSNISMRSETKEYIEQPIFDGENFYQWDKSNLSENIITKQNDLLVTYPQELVEGLGLKNPIQHIPNKERIWWNECNTVHIFISAESTYTKTFGNPDEKYLDYFKEKKDWTKIVYHVFTENSISRIYRNGGSDWFIEEMYTHNLGCTFVEVIPGKEIHKNVHAPIIYPAMWGFGDNVLNQKSDAQIVTVNNAHAIKIVQPSICPACKGDKYTIKGFGKKEECNKCDSNGMVYLNDINGVIFEKNEYSHTEKDPIPKDPVRFVKPESESVNLQNELVENLAEQYRKGLCLFERRDGAGRESADSIELQLQPQRELIATIGEKYHSVRERLLSYLQYYQLQNKSESVSVSRPTVYAVHTDSQALELVVELMNSEADVSIKEERIISYLTTYVGEQSRILKAVKILCECDPLYFYTYEQKCTGMEKGIMDEKDVKFSIYLYGKSKRIFSEEMTDDEMIAAIQKMKNENS
jgi:hypothetical protein